MYARAVIGSKAMAACTVRITVSWWVRWYLLGVQIATQAGVKPEYDKVRAAVMRGVMVKA